MCAIDFATVSKQSSLFLASMEWPIEQHLHLYASRFHLLQLGYKEIRKR
jgi:hypothetical protein